MTTNYGEEKFLQGEFFKDYQYYVYYRCGYKNGLLVDIRVTSFGVMELGYNDRPKQGREIRRADLSNFIDDYLFEFEGAN